MNMYYLEGLSNEDLFKELRDYKQDSMEYDMILNECARRKEKGLI